MFVHASQVGEIVKRADYVSVGRNDLTQYMLAVDRNNPRVTNLFSHLHPAVLRVMNKIAQEVVAAGKKLSICGEMAGNPASSVLLMAMGFDVLSMNATNLLKVKSMIRDITLVQAKELLQHALQQEDADSIKSLLDAALHGAGASRILREVRESHEDPAA